MPRRRHPFVTHTLTPPSILKSVIFIVTRSTRIETVIGDVVVSLQRADDHSFPDPERNTPLID